MRICLVLEGCYPFVRGGVSSWMHQLIAACPQHEYVLWLIGAKSEDKNKFKYELAPNVVEVHQVFLEDALHLSASKHDFHRFTRLQIQQLKELVLCQNPDWDILFRMYNEEKISPISFLTSEVFLNILLDICQEYYPYVEFADYFHTIRSMFLPILYLLGSEIPDADVYHAISTGYGGMLAMMGGWKYHRPCIVTEHGIYTREREEEILRAKWVPPQFRQHWINMFYMLSHCAYDRAVSITALFQRYSDTQADLGCPKSKLKVIGNGIKVERFASVPAKIPNGYIDITAIVRMHPIKDIKTMLYAFYTLKQRVPNARLHILGDTDDKEYGAECHALIDQLDIQDVIMPGNVDVTKYLADTDFTILTSISEGQPLSVLESMAAGRPCVTTDVGCCRDLLEGTKDDQLGISGLIVPPMHPQAFAAAMERMCKDQKMVAEMAKVGKIRVQKYYTHQDMVKKYNDNYEEVMQAWQASALN